MQITKNFDLPQNMSGYVRLDVLNLLNAQNFDSTAASYNYPNQPAYNTSGPIIGVTRTLKMTVGFKW
jgi:hypothetical protein